MKRLYHGTATTYLDSIKREGLRVVPDNRWDAYASWVNDWNPQIDEAGWSLIFLGKNRQTAKDYAEMRAKYLRGPKGAHIELPWGYAHYLIKNNPLPHDPTARPVVLRVNLPDDWPVYPDPHSFRGSVTDCPIPPQYITVDSLREGSINI